MNKTYLIILFLFITSYLKSQNVEFGIKSGINLSSFDGERDNSPLVFKSKSGIHIGVFTVFKLTEKSGIKFDFVYSMEGSNLKEPDGYIRINWISIPMVFKYYIEDGISLEIGPEIKFYSGSDMDIDLDMPEDNTKQRLDGFVEAFQPVDYGVKIGIEFKLKDNVGLSFNNYFGLKYRGYSPYYYENYFFGKSNTLSCSINYYL